MNLEEFIAIDRKEYEALIARLNHFESEKRRTFWQWVLKRPMAFLVALMVVGVMGAGATSPEGIGFISGNVYLAKSMNYRIGYVAGATDAYLTSALSEVSPPGLIMFPKCVKDLTLGQVRAITDKYLKSHPDKLHYTMATLLLMAVKESCPQ
jgi:hypothetical protein